MELVSAAEAARQLGVHPSQITRQIQSGLIPNHAPPGFDRPLISVAEAREARRAGIDRSKQRGPRSPLFAPRPLPDAAAAPQHAAGGAADQGAAPAAPARAAAIGAPAAAERAGEDAERDPNYQESRARRENAAAAKAEIELAQLRERTLDKAEVVDLAFRLGQMLREGMETRRVALAQRLVGLELPAIIAVLADADDLHLAALADAISRDLGAEEARVAA